MRLRRYWFTFKSSDETDIPAGTRLGCGITAFNYEDAMSLVREKLFENSCVPDINEVVEDIEISRLDQGHILPNMGDVTKRGIWFPLGYQ